MNGKLDLKKSLEHLYKPPADRVMEVDVPPMNFIMIDGAGDPNTSPEYAAAIEALYAVAYAIKFASKKGAAAIDYGVMPSEGLWWAADMGIAYGELDFADNKSDWLWTMMIMQPDHITAEMAAQVAADTGRKKDLSALARLRFERYHEGTSAQIMHIGPYSAEKPNIDRLHAYITAQGGKTNGKHHEIYLGDPRRTAPEKLKTILRQPLRR